MQRASPELCILHDPAALCDAVADAFADKAREAIAAHGRFGVALAGGGTPRPLYEKLATKAYCDRIDWAHVHVFFGDERCVPPDSSRSNYHMACQTLLDYVPVSSENIHRIHGEKEPHAAAESYAEGLLQFCGGRDPVLDLMLLGLGENGHTASLFPGTAALRETRKPVVAQYVEVQQEWRVTCTLPTIDAARAVWVVVQGTDKAGIVQRVLEGPEQPEVLPAQALAPTGKYRWWLDEAAAANLEATGE